MNLIDKLYGVVPFASFRGWYCPYRPAIRVDDICGSGIRIDQDLRYLPRCDICTDHRRSSGRSRHGVSGRNNGAGLERIGQGADLAPDRRHDGSATAHRMRGRKNAPLGLFYLDGIVVGKHDRSSGIGLLQLHSGKRCPGSGLFYRLPADHVPLGDLGADIDLDVSVIRFKKVTRAGNYLWLIYPPLNFYYSPKRTTFNLINQCKFPAKIYNKLIIKCIGFQIITVDNFLGKHYCFFKKVNLPL